MLYEAELHSETSDAVYIAGRFHPQAGSPAGALPPRTGSPAHFVCQRDLPVLCAGTNVRPGLGRSQAVRQRLLVPPCAGSNPAAPATRSMLNFFGFRQMLDLHRDFTSLVTVLLRSVDSEQHRQGGPRRIGEGLSQRLPTDLDQCGI